VRAEYEARIVEAQAQVRRPLPPWTGTLSQETYCPATHCGQVVCPRRCCRRLCNLEGYIVYLH
jgi:hypothetical protein